MLQHRIFRLVIWLTNQSHVLVNASLLIAALLVPAGGLYLLLGGRHEGIAVAVVVISALHVALRLFKARNFIDSHLARHLGDLEGYSAFSRKFPLYRFVDVYRAAEHVHGEAAAGHFVASSHAQESLANILNRQVEDQHRIVNKSERVARQVGPGEEQFFPTDAFFLTKPAGEDGSGGFVMRVRVAWNQDVMLEVGSRDGAQAEGLLERLKQLASRESIYRRQVIEPAFEQEVRDEFGDVERRSEVDIRFRARPDITREDVVLEPHMWAVIERNIVDFHERRTRLVSLGLPAKRGVLFYGAPGTGKSHMCKHLAWRLRTATMIVATGRTLLHIKSLCNIARMLQPAILVLEDVDLVFSERETNAYSVALGEVMDELDGFAREDNLIFILTTNAIDRVERAIRERPGRISQCVHFGTPSAALRERFLARQLGSYDTSGVDMAGLVARTEGATQAFLKEFVFRAVQIASEKDAAESAELALSDAHFVEALREMKEASDAAGQAIIGFRSEEPGA